MASLDHTIWQLPSANAAAFTPNPTPPLLLSWHLVMVSQDRYPCIALHSGEGDEEIFWGRLGKGRWWGGRGGGNVGAGNRQMTT